LKRFLIFALLLIIAFAAGYGVLFFEIRDLRERSSVAERNLRDNEVRLERQVLLESVHGDLGLVILELQMANFGNARAGSSAFFAKLARLEGELPDGEPRKRLEAIRQRRDEITADLAAMNPATAEKLKEIYRELVAIAAQSRH
jgi:hypothetical protein